MKQNKCNLLLYVHVFVPVHVCTRMSSHVSIRMHVRKRVCYVCVSVSLSSLTDMWLLSTLFFFFFWPRSLTEHGAHQFG